MANIVRHHLWINFILFRRNLSATYKSSSNGLLSNSLGSLIVPFFWDRYFSGKWIWFRFELVLLPKLIFSLRRLTSSRLIPTKLFYKRIYSEDYYSYYLDRGLIFSFFIFIFALVLVYLTVPGDKRFLYFLPMLALFESSFLYLDGTVNFTSANSLLLNTPFVVAAVLANLLFEFYSSFLLTFWFSDLSFFSSSTTILVNYETDSFLHLESLFGLECDGL